MTISFVPLLSIAFNVVHIMCWFVATLGNRGWPLWFPRWFPSPDSVMNSLPLLALILLGITWYWSRSRFNSDHPCPRDFIILRNVATGIAGLVILMNVVVYVVW